ncbi:hypothetical protein [Lysobacter capsici]|uniref:hypothetical protein n=1 Tax=Lysobacter capsici TaxID=435897 RepID=UPI0006279EBD|nr:hypothetical protein [Lysobacter capsici]
MKKMVWPVLLAFSAMQAHAAQEVVTEPLRLVTFAYQSEAWEGRSNLRKEPNYAIRFNDSGLVFSIMEDKAKPGEDSADKILAVIVNGLRNDFEMTPSDAMDKVSVSEGWSCHSFKVKRIGTGTVGLSRSCVKLFGKQFAWMTIINPAEVIDEPTQEALNQVLASLKDAEKVELLP